MIKIKNKSKIYTADYYRAVVITLAIICCCVILLSSMITIYSEINGTLSGEKTIAFNSYYDNSIEIFGERYNLPFYDALKNYCETFLFFVKPTYFNSVKYLIYGLVQQFAET